MANTDQRGAMSEQWIKHEAFIFKDHPVYQLGRTDAYFGYCGLLSDEADDAVRKLNTFDTVAAERDWLRSLNAELVTEIQNSLIEHQCVLGFLRKRAAEGESLRVWIEMAERRIAGCQAAIAKAAAPAQPIPASAGGNEWIQEIEGGKQ